MSDIEKTEEVVEEATPETNDDVTPVTKSADTQPSQIDKLMKTVHDLKGLVEKANHNKTSEGLRSDDREQIDRATSEVAMLQKQVDELIQFRSERKGQFDVSDSNRIDYSQKSIQGLLQAKAVADSEVEQIQKANDDMYIAMTLMRISDPRQSKALMAYVEENYPTVYKGMNTGAAGSGEVLGTTGEGAQWVPNDFSSQLIRDVRLNLRVAALHDRFNMPTNPFTFPVEGVDMTAYRVSERTGDNDSVDSSKFVTASTPGTTNLTFAAQKIGTRAVVSTEITEDSIIPIIGYVREKTALALANAQENAVINGDVRTSGAIDGVTLGTDQVTAYDGYRRAAQLAGTTSDVAGATLSLGAVRKLRSDMAKFGVDNSQLAYVVGINAWNQMLSIPEVITLDKFGSRATILTGQLGSIDSIPIIVSEHVREDLDTQGENSGSGSTTEILLVHRGAYRFGDRRQITLKTREVIETDQQVLVALQRLDFKPLYAPASNNITAAGVNILLA